jgi:hypothetical protein
MHMPIFVHVVAAFNLSYPPTIMLFPFNIHYQISVVKCQHLRILLGINNSPEISNYVPNKQE